MENRDVLFAHHFGVHQDTLDVGSMYVGPTYMGPTPDVSWCMYTKVMYKNH